MIYCCFCFVRYESNSNNVNIIDISKKPRKCIVGIVFVLDQVYFDMELRKQYPSLTGPFACLLGGGYKFDQSIPYSNNQGLQKITPQLKNQLIKQKGLREFIMMVKQHWPHETKHFTCMDDLYVKTILNPWAELIMNGVKRTENMVRRYVCKIWIPEYKPPLPVKFKCLYCCDDRWMLKNGQCLCSQLNNTNNNLYTKPNVELSPSLEPTTDIDINTSKTIETKEDDDAKEEVSALHIQKCAELVNLIEEEWRKGYLYMKHGERKDSEADIMRKRKYGASMAQINEWLNDIEKYHPQRYNYLMTQQKYQDHVTAWKNYQLGITFWSYV